MENKKFEITSETKVFLGVNLYRIKALKTFGSVVKGELGGWVAGKENLSATGDAWVYDDARVYGDARISDDALVYGDAGKSPIIISGLYYRVTITDSHIRIGCEFHSTTKWENFSNEEIKDMDGKTASDFWLKYKEIIISTARLHQN